jgi:hypothetical protein
MRARPILLACLAFAAVAPAALAQPQPPAAAVAAAPLTAAERAAAVETLARELEARYVFPDVAARYAAMLRRNLAAGAYNGFDDPVALGRKVTEDLQAVSPDRHLRLAPNEVFQPSARAMTSGRGQAPEALEEAKMIGDVAYLRFNIFPNDAQVAARARQFLIDHADAKAVILDVRPNRGGGLMVMDAILPLLFAETTTLVRMDTRAAVAQPGEPETLVLQASPPSVVRHDHVVTPSTAERRLQRAPTFYLTSNRTASAAEHLAMALKRTKRATLIGETTRGAGHFGGLTPIGERFSAFIPVGRTYDPATGEGWEAVGVTPDVAVPADRALDEALLRAVAAGAHTT